MARWVLRYSSRAARHSATNVEELTDLIAEVKLGNKRAYEPIVKRFQDMAVAYGYATLGDWQLAEDAAQEAFIAAYCELSALRDPQAFPGWFRRIVIKQIDRIRRGRPRYVPLDELSNVPAHQQNPSDIARATGAARFHRQCDPLAAHSAQRGCDSVLHWHVFTERHQCVSRCSRFNSQNAPVPCAKNATRRACQ